MGEQPDFTSESFHPVYAPGPSCQAPLPSNFEPEPFVSSLVRQMRHEALSIFNGADAVSFSPSSGSCGSRLAAAPGLTGSVPASILPALSRKRFRFATIHMESFEGSGFRARLGNLRGKHLIKRTRAELRGEHPKTFFHRAPANCATSCCTIRFYEALWSNWRDTVATIAGIRLQLHAAGRHDQAISSILHTCICKKIVIFFLAGWVVSV